MSEQYGLIWSDESIWGLEPQWSVEPDLKQIERVSRRHLELEDDGHCTVTPYAQGVFNKLFVVKAHAENWLMRVALPVDPSRKTASEAATLGFVRQNTSTPVPKVFGYDASNENDLRFEWILMEHMPGMPMEQAWRMMPMSQKVTMARKLAQYQSELFRHALPFHKLGNIYNPDSGAHEIGPMVSMTFFWGDRGTRTVNRGPFRNSHEWLLARLSLTIETQDEILANTEDKDEFEDAERAKGLAKRLIILLPSIFSRDEVDTTMLFHDDLHQDNILVDQSGTITALLDWECVSVFPLWMACQPPAVLKGPTCDGEPQKEEYAPYNPEIKGDDPENLNRGVDSLSLLRTQLTFCSLSLVNFVISFSNKLSFFTDGDMLGSLVRRSISGDQSEMRRLHRGRYSHECLVLSITLVSEGSPSRRAVNI